MLVIENLFLLLFFLMLMQFPRKKLFSDSYEICWRELCGMYIYIYKCAVTKIFKWYNLNRLFKLSLTIWLGFAYIYIFFFRCFSLHWVYNLCPDLLATDLLPLHVKLIFFMLQRIFSAELAKNSSVHICVISATCWGTLE